MFFSQTTNTRKLSSKWGYLGVISLCLLLLAAQTLIDLTSQVKGTLPHANGGTDNTSYIDGQLLIGQTSTNGLVKNTLTAGTGITVTNGSGTITVATTAFNGNFADSETPTGSINGINQTFTLAHTPSPAASLQLFWNGQLLKSGGADYTLATATITTVATPKTGDVLLAWYRY